MRSVCIGRRGENFRWWSCSCMICTRLCCSAPCSTPLSPGPSDCVSLLGPAVRWRRPCTISGRCSGTPGWRPPSTTPAPSPLHRSTNIPGGFQPHTGLLQKPNSLLYIVSQCLLDAQDIVVKSKFAKVHHIEWFLTTSASQQELKSRQTTDLSTALIAQKGMTVSELKLT